MHEIPSLMESREEFHKAYNLFCSPYVLCVRHFYE